MKYSTKSRLFKLAAGLWIAFAATSAVFAFKNGIGGNPIHQNISKDALNPVDGIDVALDNWHVTSFSDDVVDFIADRNADTDKYGFFDPVMHFDEEKFNESNMWLYRAKSLIASLLAKPNFTQQDIRDARAALGYALHTVQDFYAHSSWIEMRLKDPFLPQPTLGRLDAFEALKKYSISVGTGNRPSCSGSGLLADSPLVTGYYHFEMNNPRFNSQNMYGADTNSWNQYPLLFLNWPANRCIHGGDGDTPGLNHDSEERPHHIEARQYALIASKRFTQDVLAEIRRLAGDQANLAVCALVGRTGEPICSVVLTGPAAVDAVNFDRTAKFHVVETFRLSVTGELLPPGLSVQLGAVDCARVGAQSKRTLIVDCTPYDRGEFSLEVISASGATLKSEKIRVEVAKVNYSSDSPALLQEVTLWITNAAREIVSVAWTLVDKIGGVVENTTLSIIDTLEKVFLTSGEKAVGIAYKDASGNVIGSASVAITVSSLKVESVEPATASILGGQEFIVRGAKLPTGLSFSLQDCDDVRDILTRASATERHFTCTFAPNTTAGIKHGVIATSSNPLLGEVIKEFTVTATSSSPTPENPSVFSDDFNGAALDSAKWTSSPYKPGFGDPTVANGLVHLANCQSANTSGKVAISGSRIVIESRFVGPKGSGRDSYISLIDASTGSLLQIGDSDYWSGIYLQLSKNSVYDAIKSYPGTSTNQFKEYRITLEGKKVTIERGDSLDALVTKITETLPRSMTDGTYYIKIGTGGCDGIYSPADFDWLRVYTRTGSFNAANNIPGTGITATQCYRSGSNVLINCTSLEALALFDKQDGMITPGSAGTSYALVQKAGGGSYDKAECVQDNITGLVWEGKTADAGLRGQGQRYTNTNSGLSNDTSGYATAVNAIQLCGRSDWRLPTASELQLIVNYGAVEGAASIEGAWFPNTALQQHWTTSTLQGRNPAVSMFVDFRSGDVGGLISSQLAAVRLVSGAARSVAAFQISVDGTEAKDPTTGLIWRRCIEGASWNGTACTSDGATTFTHEAAFVRAIDQRSASKGWRVPNVKELTSLVRRDGAEPTPYIDNTIFSGTPNGYFWTSSPFVSQSSMAWTVYFGYGSTGSNQSRATPRNLRLVRND